METETCSKCGWPLRNDRYAVLTIENVWLCADCFWESQSEPEPEPKGAYSDGR